MVTNLLNLQINDEQGIVTGQVIAPDAFKQTGAKEDVLEQQLIAALKAGQQSALKPLYDKYLKRVYALCLRLCGDPEIAEDICQEVFVQVWQKINNFRGDSKFSTWLYAVTSNLAVNHMRKQKRWWHSWFKNDDQTTGESIIDCLPSNDEQSDFAVWRNGLDKHILALPEQARIVFVLFAIEGWRHEEIAKELNIAVGSSKAQYHRAKKLLQATLVAEEKSGKVAS